MGNDVCNHIWNIKDSIPTQFINSKRSHENIESTSVRKMAAFDNFKNCSNLTDEQIEVMVLVRGVSAAVWCAILSTVLVMLVILATLPKTRNRVC